MASCNGTSATVQDWLHANSASISALDGSIIISIRHLSTICSFIPSPGAQAELQWCVLLKQTN